MNIDDARMKIELVKKNLLEMKETASFVDSRAFEPDEVTGQAPLEGGDQMATVNPNANERLHSLWEEIQKSVPPGFSIDGNLIRHLSFNEAHDWVDIHHSDIPRELTKIDEYENRLALIEYLSELHPEVARVAETVLNGDIEMALKGVYANLDSKIRSLLRLSGNESTVPFIGKAFKDGTLVTPRPENMAGARDFLMGVVGYYRHRIVHNPLSPARNRIEASLSLFALAHEAFLLLDACSGRLRK